MPLKITLKPQERLFIGTSSVIVVADRLMDVVVDGDQPILRERDFLEPEYATSDARRAYLALQDSYLTKSIETGRDEYLGSIASLLAAKPDANHLVRDINVHLTAGDLYKALRAARLLVQWDEGSESWAEVVTVA